MEKETEEDHAPYTLTHWKKTPSKCFFFSIIMIVTRYKTIKKNTCNSAPTTIYYAVGGKSKSKILSSNNSWHGKL